MLTDLPGFGFMAGVPAEAREDIKTGVVRYLEDYADSISVGVLVLDGKSAVDIIDRHEEQGEYPHDVELFDFLGTLGIQRVVAVNKMDKVDDRDARLDAIAERLGLFPPWQQWQDTIAPVTAKRGSIEALKRCLETHLREQGHGECYGCIS